MSATQEPGKFGQTHGLLTAVMASCRDAIIACSLEGQIEAWNRGAEQIYGFRSDEAIGQSADLTTPAERAAELERLVEAACEGRSIEHFDTVRIRKSGEAFPAAVCGFPIRDSTNEVVGYATVERDISDRVKAADALRQALGEAKEASRAKSRFLANASHELRTPMNAIVGMTALAMEESVSDELREYLETIRDSADSMLHLINDLLDLSKYEAEGFVLDEATFDPRDVVEGTVKALAAAAHAKGLELVCNVAPDMPAGVVGDPVRLRQVLTNLVGNAIKFTEQGDVIVEASLIAHEQDACRVRFRVTDTGIGISAEDQERVFAAFTQVDSNTTRQYGGTGLGLTITRHLVTCFGGDLRVDSRLGEGSTFEFELLLPMVESEATLTAEEFGDLGGLNALIVDDSEASLDALVKQADAWGIRAVAVSSGEKARTELRAAAHRGAPFDFALIDALMPGVDGFDVASDLLQQSEIGTKPILMASATDRLEFGNRYAQVCHIACVQKPVSQSQLLAAITQSMRGDEADSSTHTGLFDKPEVPPLHVLVVEDTPANQKLVERVLARRGHRHQTAVNGRDAIDAFRRSRFDLVLMDVQMPIMDGLQAAEAIRQLERAEPEREPTPIIAMTAHSMRGDRQQCLLAGMDGYLSKPLDLVQLIDTVESVGASAAPDGDAAVSETLLERVLDINAALKRLRGDETLLREMMGFYLEDSPGLLDELNESLRTESWARATRGCHGLKGLAASIGGNKVAAAAAALEEACAAESERCKGLLDRARKEHHALVQELRAYEL